MKQVHANYTFVASTKTITLTGLNIAQDQLLLVTNATRGVIYYNFASSSHRAVVTAGANTTVVLTDASTTGHADSDQLTIHYDDQLSTQTIAGTVTATLNLSNLVDGQAIGIPLQYNNTVDSDAATVVNIYKAPGSDTGGLPIQNTKNSVDESIIPLAISGTVTVGNSVTIGSLPAISGTVTVGNSVTIGSLPAISGTVTVGNSVTIGSLPTLTPQLPRVTFIDGSGTVVTANSAVTLFASSSTRSYLLVQVTTGSAFVNVGATATTLNGISLTAGQGYAWETTIPQGAVSLISTTTNSAYVAKQA